MAEQAIGEIIKAISGDVKELVRDEVQLAKAELAPAAKAGGIGAGPAPGAAFFGVSAVFILYFCVVYVLVRLGLPEWASFLIVGAALLLLAGVLGAIGYTMIKKVKPPQRSIAAGEGDRRRGQGVGTADARRDQGQPDDTKAIDRVAARRRQHAGHDRGDPRARGAWIPFRRPGPASEQEDPRLPRTEVGPRGGRRGSRAAARRRRARAANRPGPSPAATSSSRRAAASAPPASGGTTQSCGS